MDATFTLTHVDFAQALPTDPAARVAWLEQYGTPPLGYPEVVVTAPLSVWLDAGATITARGTIERIPMELCRALKQAALGEYWVHQQIPTLCAVHVESAAESVRHAAAEARERAIAGALESGDEFWRAFDRSEIPYSARDYADDPRIQARLRAVDAAIASEREAKVTAAAERSARIEACKAAIRGLARQEDALARAEADGYPVERKTLDLLAERLAGAVSAPYHGIDGALWRDSVRLDRAAPNAEAFDLLDRVTAAARTANESLPYAIGHWVVSRILRLDVCPHVRKNHYVTAVLATLETPLDDRELTFSNEPIACDHEARNHEE